MLSRLDPEQGAVTGTTKLAFGIYQAAKAFGELWVLNFGGDQIWRIEPGG